MSDGSDTLPIDWKANPAATIVTSIATAPTYSSFLRPHFSTRWIAGKVKSMLTVGTVIMARRPCHPRVAEDRRRVVDHHVDADELLEHLEQDADQQHLEEVAAQHDLEPRPLRAVQRLFDFADLLVDLRLGVQRPPEDRDRLVLPSLEHQPPRALGEDEAAGEHQRREERHGQEHQRQRRRRRA